MPSYEFILWVHRLVGAAETAAPPKNSATCLVGALGDKCTP